MKKLVTKLLTIAIIMLLSGAYLAGCGKTTKASEPKVAEEAAETAEEAAEAAETAEEVTEAAETAEEATEAAETAEEAAEEAETAEETTKEAETAEEATEEAETAEEQEVSEEERLAAFVSSLEKLDPVKDRYALNSELVRVKNDEENVEFQRAVIQHLMSAKTEQVSPCTEGEYPIIRVFKGFTLVDAEGRVEAYQDGLHLHFKGEGWKILNGHGVETVEDNAVVWKLGDFPFWVLAQKGEQVYIFHWLEKADAEDDPVFSGYNADIRQRVKAIVAQCEEEGTVSEKNRNLLESIAFQLSLKEVSSDDYCIVQYLTRDECRGTDWSRRTLINLKVDDEGVPQRINSDEASLVVLKEDVSIKVTIVTDEEVTIEERDDK